MRRFSFIITILLLTLVSCAESGIKEYRNDYQVAPERLTATFEGVESTRIELQELNSVWSAGDEVSVFYRSYSNLKYKFDGNSGDSAGTLSLVAGEQGEATLDKSYMLYPYSENNSLGEDGMLYTSLPAEQSYKANSYGVGGNILVAESTTSQFVLNNVCGWIRIQLTGDGEVVHSMTLSSNKNEALAGDIMVNSSDASYTLLSSGGSSITLDCGEGVTLSESVTEFYIGILPQGLEGGITVDIVTDQDSVSKSTYEAVVVERNHILPMTAFRLSGEEAVHSELRYTATALVEPNNTSAFNAAAAIVSNEWDEETGEGVITFNGELTMIGYEAFSNCTSLTSVTIPNSVTTIEERAFIGCSSLTSVTIGNSVTKIGIGVFCGCINLAEFKGKFAEDGGRCLIIDGVLNAFAFGCGVTEYTIPDSVTTIGDMALYNCDSLTSVTIPDSVTTIGVWAFYVCDSLTSVTIGDSVTTIGDSAFYYCSSLTSVYCEATTPPTLGDSYVFDDNASGRKIYVTAESVEAYKAAENWNKYAADIVGYDFETGEEVAISNKLFYTATAKVEPYKASAFNVAIVSNEWDEETGEGVITFDGELTTIGVQAFYNCSSLTSVTIPDSVTTIGEGAFHNCYNLTSVTIPDSVTTIGGDAFGFCHSLTSVTIPDSVTTIGVSAFNSCYSLTSVTIGNSVTSIGDKAFFDCRSLTSVTIPDSVTTIGVQAFMSCSSLTSVYITDVAAWCNISFGDQPLRYGADLYLNNELVTDLTIPDSVTMIGYQAFFFCKSLTSVVIPDSVTTIGNYAFYDCESLTSVTIPDSVTTIGDEAFYSCDSLTSVTIGDSVTTIGSRAFCYCHSLTSVTIPDSVTTIGEAAFGGCRNLAEFKGKFAADGGRCLVKDNTMIAYAEASGTTYTIPDSVTTIGNSAFSWCESLTSVTIPDSVTTIVFNAFYWCSSLTSVTIPDSVTTIGDYAFCYCGSLTSVYCKATTPPTLGYYVFDANAAGHKIYVPSESVEGYKAAENWSEYAADIVGYNFETGEEVAISNKLFYTATALVEPHDASAFNVSIVSNEWDEATGEGVITFDGKLTMIGYEAFYFCKSLTSVVIPDSVTTIGSDAFSNCDSLTSVKIGDSVTTIGSYVFRYCGLTSVTIPDSVTTIGEAAFIGCDSLTSVTIGDSVTEIGDYAFNSCVSLTSVTIPDSVTTIGNFAFDCCYSLTSVTIGESVTTIGGNAFSNCTSLTSVTIPDSVTTIGEKAFSYCDSLTSVTIGDSVTTIGDRVFAFCGNLTSVTIPNSVTTIGEKAFFNCTSLTSVYCKATTPPSLGDDAFKYQDNGYVNIGCAIYLPAESVEVYKEAENWSEYAADIVGYYFE